MSFSELEYAAKKKQTRRDRFLVEIEAITSWSSLTKVIAPHYPSSGGRGCPPVGLERILRMYVAQQCFGLSDEGTEDALYDSQAIRRFVGIDLNRELLEKIEHTKASIRAKVEHPFHVVKNLFRHRKTRYKGLAKNTVQLFSLLGFANLMLARRWLFGSGTQVTS